MSATLRTLHGMPDGRLLIIESLVGNIYPPVPGYVHLGGACDVFARLNFHVKQSDLAVMFGVTQQSVSRYVSGSSEPHDLEAWAPIIRLLFGVCLSQPDHAHTVELYRANIGRKLRSVSA